MPAAQNIRARLAAGDVLIGTMLVEIRNPVIARMLATTDIDFVIIDMEHGTYSWETMQSIIVMARASGMDAVVRVPEIRRETIMKPLDAGAHALLIPQVNDVAQAREIVEFAKYAPLGKRGTALGRAHCDYRAVDPCCYLATANDGVGVIIQIETQQAVASVDALASVVGVDAMFVGPMDLSVDMGIPGEVGHPRIIDAIETVVRAGERHGVATGIQLFNAQSVSAMAQRGVRMISYSTDVQLILGQLGAVVATVREREMDRSVERFKST